MAAIEIQGLSKRFGEITAVDDLSFSTREGAVTGFLGPNGAGKTTTLRMLLGLVTPTGRHGNGRRPPLRFADPTRRRWCSSEVGRARQHLRVLATAAGLPLLERVDEVLDEVGLAEAGDRRVKGFSLGMRQRLGLASALLAAPNVLILDEPTNGLDPRRPLVAAVPAQLRRPRRQRARVEPLAGRGRTDGRRRRDHRQLSSSSPRYPTWQPSQSGVRVRTPHAETLRAALTAEGIAAELVAADVVMAFETTAEAVGLAAAGAAAVIYEMTVERFNLEELFLELTTSEGALR